MEPFKIRHPVQKYATWFRNTRRTWYGNDREILFSLFVVQKFIRVLPAPLSNTVLVITHPSVNSRPVSRWLLPLWSAAPLSSLISDIFQLSSSPWYQRVVSATLQRVRYDSLTPNWQNDHLTLIILMDAWVLILCSKYPVCKYVELLNRLAAAIQVTTLFRVFLLL